MSRAKALKQQEGLLVSRLGFGAKRELGDEKKADFAWNLLASWPDSGDNFATLGVILSHALDGQSIYNQRANEWVDAHIATSRSSIFFALLHIATLSPARQRPVAKMADKFRPLKNTEQRLLLEAMQGNPHSWEQIRSNSPMPDSPPSHRSDVIAACKLLMPQPNDQEVVAIALLAAREPQLQQMPSLQAAIVRVFVRTGDDNLLHVINDHFSLFAEAMVNAVCYRSAGYHTEQGYRLRLLAHSIANNITLLPGELAQSVARRLTGSRTFDGFSVYRKLIESGEEISLDYLADMLSGLCNERHAVCESLGSVREVEKAKEMDRHLQIYEQEADLCIADIADKLGVHELVTLVGKLHEHYDRFPDNPLLVTLSTRLLARKDLTPDNMVWLVASRKLPTEMLVDVMGKFEHPWHCNLFQQWLRNPTFPTSDEGKRSLDSLLRGYIQALAKTRASEEQPQLTVGKLTRTRIHFLFNNGYVPSALDFQLAEGEEMGNILPWEGHDYLHTPQIWQDPAWKAVLLKVAANDKSGTMLRWLLDSSEPVLSLQERRSNKQEEVEAGVRWLNSVLPSWQDQTPTMRLAWIQMVTARRYHHRLILPYLANAWEQMSDDEKKQLSSYAKKNWQFITEHAIPANFVGFMATVLTGEEQLDAFFAQPIHSGETNKKIGRFSELSHLFKTPEAQKRLLSWMMKHAEILEPHTLTSWMLRFNFQRFVNVRIILRRLRVERLFSKKTIEELEQALEPYGAT